MIIRGLIPVLASVLTDAMSFELVSDMNAPQFVVCISSADYPASLELHKIYRALPDDDAAADGDIRVVDESGEDYLYPAEYFVAIVVPHEVAASLLKTA